jgi:membrane-bound lytic murein transglycosylase MltF
MVRHARSAGLGRALGLPCLLTLCLSCAGPDGQRAEASPSQAGDPLPPSAFETAIPEALRELVSQPFTGDLDEMEARRMIRVGVAYNRTHYFIDQGTQRGLTVAFLREFENDLNTARRTRNMRIHVVIIPLPRDLLIPALIDGHLDAVAAQKTITPERLEVVDFSAPLRRNISEIVVTGPGSPAIASAEDLSGKEVFVRRSSSYFQSLTDLNARLAKDGRPPAMIRLAPENLEDDDLLEMVNAGMIDATVVDDYLARFWVQIFTDLRLHENATLRQGAELAVAFRKNSPKLAAEANAFIARNRIGTTFGNIIDRRYLRSTQAVQRATSGGDLARFLSLQELFRKRSAEYDLDYLLMMAQGYRESRLDQSVRSPVGAIGVMQIMPATGASLGVGDIRQLEPNVHGGIRYVRRLIDDYLGNEPFSELDRGLFAMASYNAGPTRIRQLRREAERRGLDPNVWFGNVEIIASERIGRETVSYVSMVYKYYIAFRLAAEMEQSRIEQRLKLEEARRPGSPRP